jgi:para-aminobenzoate synthetase/4-amino-4-deoxychorismate lyase
MLWNERGEVTEGCTTNVAIRQGHAWITPPLACGVLEGVMREELLARGEITEGVITLEAFRRAPEIVLFNSVRGWMAARLD